MQAITGNAGRWAKSLASAKMNGCKNSPFTQRKGEAWHVAATFAEKVPNMEIVSVTRTT
jgi:hypothetical protein